MQTVHCVLLELFYGFYVSFLWFAKMI